MKVLAVRNDDWLEIKKGFMYDSIYEDGVLKVVTPRFTVIFDEKDFKKEG